MAIDAPRQLWPNDKITFSPFSYAQAIIKDNTTYPIVPNCPIINVDNPAALDVSNIPVGTLFIVHISVSSSNWMEVLCLRVPDDTEGASWGELWKGYVVISQRTNSTSSGGGNSYI